jgi:hypothetical protein
MRAQAAAGIIIAMTRLARSTRVLLLEERRTQGEDPSYAPIRRYRLARLRFEPRDPSPASPQARLRLSDQTRP